MGNDVRPQAQTTHKPVEERDAAGFFTGNRFFCMATPHECMVKANTANNAALKLCTVLLYAEGYRPVQSLAHYRTLKALPLILGEDRKADADYLDTCRTKRNTIEYVCVGSATRADAGELIKFAQSLEKDVMEWLHSRHPDLVLPMDWL